MKYRVSLEVDVREEFCSIEEFTKYIIQGINHENKGLFKVKVLKVEKEKE